MESNIDKIIEIINSEKERIDSEILIREMFNNSIDKDYADKVKRINNSKEKISNYIKYINVEKFTTWQQIKYNQDEWYTLSKNCDVNKEVIVAEDEGGYIAYKENKYFAVKPIETNINIEENYIYKFKFNANSTTETSYLYIIAYSKDEKREVYAVSINDEITIKFSKDIDQIRLAIKCTGKGTLEINNILIERKRVLGLMDIESYRRLGFDKPKTLNELKVAAICDEFTYECLKSEVDLITFRPDEWRAKLEITKPHILFIESVWLGEKGEWSRKVCSHNGSGLEYLKEIIEWCKNRNIPTIFWNKEDPIHFKGFINAAKLCEYIYTTDANMIEEYKKQAPNSKIDVMQFFARPYIHNPIKMFKERKNSACFAGSYYAIKFEERQKDMLDLLNITKALDLVIYDRHFGENNPQYEFPKEFKKYIVGKLPPWEVVKAYKEYKYLVNVNSVVNSPTMFSRRVFEGLACGTPIVSTYSEAIEKTFGDIVIMGNNYEEIKEKFNNVVNNDNLYNKLKVSGIREVYSKHTIKHRFNKICKDVGIEVNNKEEKIALVAFIRTKASYKRFIDIVSKQKAENLYGIAISTLELTDNENIIKVNNEEELIKKCREVDYIATINTNSFYGRNYILDLYLATKYSKSNILGKFQYVILKGKKDEFFNINDGKEYEYCNKVNKNTIFISSELFNKYPKDEVLNVIINGDIKSLLAFGERAFSIDKYNFIEGGNDCAEELINQIEI